MSFHGEEGRQAVFDFAGLPLPGWHQALAAGLAERTGPAGGLRTLASAGSCWAVTKRLVRFVASQPGAPATPGSLTRAHMEGFLRHRAAAIGSPAAWREVRMAGRLLSSLPGGHKSPGWGLILGFALLWILDGLAAFFLHRSFDRSSGS